MKTYEYVNFGLFGNLANLAGKVGGFFGNAGQAIGTGVSNAAQAVGNTVTNAANAVKTGVGNAVTAVKNDWNSMGDQLKSGFNDVRNGVGQAQPVAQPTVAEDNTVVKNPNTPNFEDIDTNQALGDVTQGGMANAQTQRNITQGVQQIEADKVAAQKKAEQDRLAAEAAKKKKAEDDAAALQAQQLQQAKQNQSDRFAKGMQQKTAMGLLSKLQKGTQLNPNELSQLRGLGVNPQMDTQSMIKQLQGIALAAS